MNERYSFFPVPKPISDFAHNCVALSLMQQCSLVSALDKRLENLADSNIRERATKAKLEELGYIVKDDEYAGVPNKARLFLTDLIENFIGDALPISAEDIMSSPLLKWSHIQMLSMREVVGSVLSDEMVERAEFNLTLTDLWIEAVSHGLRARRVIETTITLCNLLQPTFHNIDLEHQTWKSCLDSFQIRYTYLWWLGLATPYMKFHTAYLFNCFMKQQEYPPTPNFCSLLFKKPGKFLGGVGYVWLTRMISWANPAVATTFLHLKRGLPPVHPCELSQATHDWYITLTKKNIYPTGGLKSSSRDIHHKTPAGLDAWRQLSNGQKRLVLANQVRRTVYELFPRREFTVDSIRVPSGRSHIEMSRKKGGAFTHIHRSLTGLGVKKEKESVRCQGNRGPGIDLREKDSKTNPRARSIASWKLSETKDSAIASVRGMNLLRVHVPYVRTKPYPCVGCQPLKDVNGRYQFYIYEVFDESGNEFIDYWENQTADYNITLYINHICDRVLTSSDDNVVSPVALPEPLKTRLISRGPSDRYWLGSMLQKWMHSTIRGHGVFRAIGRPLIPEDIDVLGTCDLNESYLSGDYKAATDLLDPFLSLECCEALIERGSLPPVLQSILKDGLVGARLESTVFTPEAVAGKELKQTWGQLMGSPLSFPVLCIVNAAANRYFYEMTQNAKAKERLDKGLAPEHSSIWKLSELPCLINGDDILMRIPTDCYADWKEFIQVAGLVPSVGKNYLSSEFVIINSTLYTQSGPTIFGSSNFQEVPYMNLGLIQPYMSDRASLQSDHFTLDPIVWDLGSVSRAATKGHRLDVRDRIMSFFLGNPLVKDLLGSIPRGVSYFVSKTLGGVGLALTRDNLLSEAQRTYYTIIATTRGELAPLLPDTLSKMHGPQTLWAKVEPACDLGEEWTLTDTVWSSPSSKRLWSEYLSNNVSMMVCENGIRETLSASDRILLNGRQCRGYMLNVMSPVSTGLLKPNRRIKLWPESLLSTFPWIRRKLQVFDEPTVEFGLSELWQSDRSSITQSSESIGVLSDIDSSVGSPCGIPMRTLVEGSLD